MVKYARIVFEEEIPDNATAEDALAVLLKCMKNAPTYLKGEDVEISEAPYERMEQMVDSDI
jgi:hypothetical protein